MDPSPIKTFAKDWPRLSLTGKRQYLMASGQAKDWHAASVLLGRHSAWCRSRRHDRQGGRRERKQAIMAEAQAVVDKIETVTLSQGCACADCDTVLAELVIDTQGQRRLTPLCDQGRVGRDRYCLPCIEKMVAAGMIEKRAA